MRANLSTITTVCLLWIVVSTWAAAQSVPSLEWTALPSIPDELGLAGPVIGVYEDILIVGGGANFAKPVWENAKQWHDAVYTLDLRRPDATWQWCGMLPSALAYCACASTPDGVAVMGGNDQQQESNKCWLLKPQREFRGRISMQIQPLPDLPTPLVYGQAVWSDHRLVVLSGQTGKELSTAIAGGWQLKIANGQATEAWQSIGKCPGGPRAFAMLSTAPGAKANQKLYLMGGRHQVGTEIRFLNDMWQYDLNALTWQQLASLPVPVAAGGAGPIAESVVAVVSGDDGRLFTQTDQLKDDHPGFAKRTWLYDIFDNRWQAGPPSPSNQVTTTPVVVGSGLIVASGEVRPRVRTSQVWQVTSRP